MRGRKDAGNANDYEDSKEKAALKATAIKLKLKIDFNFIRND